MHMIRWTLEHNGYSTIVAHHGGEAMHAVRERGGQIDLLITGVIRSACGSSIAADAIRAERPGIKVLYVSKDVAGVTTPFGLEKGPVFLGGPYAPYALPHRVRVGRERALPAEEGGHEQEQGRPRQVEVGDQPVHHPEAVPRRDEEPGLARARPECCSPSRPAAAHRWRSSHPPPCCSWWWRARASARVRDSCLRSRSRSRSPSRP